MAESRGGVGRVGHRRGTSAVAAHRPRSARERTGKRSRVDGIGVPVAPSTGAVLRRSFLARLDAADSPLILVEAPAGFGKTTAVAQWAGLDPRPVAWLTVPEATNEADDLTTAIVGALHAVPRLRAAATAASGDPSRALGRLASALRHVPQPFVLVLDEADRVGARAHTVVRSVARALPRGSQLVLVARGFRQLSAAATAAGGSLTTVGPDDLAMSADEAAELFRDAGIPLARDEVDVLVRTTGGWPAALVLAASSISLDPDVTGAAATFGAADPTVEEFLEGEVLARLSAGDRDLLAASSVLHRLSGPACDAVLTTSGSAQVLGRVARKVGPVMRKEVGSASYELHPLVRDLLRAQLERRDPGRARELLSRASGWYESRQEWSAAIVLAHAARDHRRAVRLTWQAAPLHAPTDPLLFSEWMGLWSDEEIARDPVLCICAAWGALARGDLASVHRWSTFARRADERLVLPDGRPFRAMLALLRAVAGREGLRRMVDDARLASELGRDPALAFGRYACGSACRLLGDAGAARAQLESAVAQVSELDAAVEAHCLVQLALLAAGDGDWQEARTLAARARRRVGAADAPGPPATAAVAATLAWFDALDGKPASGDALERARTDLDRVATEMPWLAIDARLLLGTAALRSGDPMLARALAHEVEQLLAAWPDAGELPARLDTLRSAIRSEQLPVGFSAAGLTPAETRVLEYLPTHLTFPEIAEALYVSRHTVKTQAVAVYRKLGVSSRSAAVAAARELGFLPD